MLMKLNEGEQRVFLICIPFGLCEVGHLTWALVHEEVSSSIKLTSDASSKARVAGSEVAGSNPIWGCIFSVPMV